MMRWIKRIAATLGIVLMVALLASVVYEQLILWRAARMFPPVGRLVDVDGERMQIDCRGAGSPTVVFEARLDILG